MPRESGTYTHPNAQDVVQQQVKASERSSNGSLESTPSTRASRGQASPGGESEGSPPPRLEQVPTLPQLQEVQKEVQKEPVRQDAEAQLAHNERELRMATQEAEAKVLPEFGVSEEGAAEDRSLAQGAKSQHSGWIKRLLVAASFGLLLLGGFVYSSDIKASAASISPISAKRAAADAEARAAQAAKAEEKAAERVAEDKVEIEAEEDALFWNRWSTNPKFRHAKLAEEARDEAAEHQAAAEKAKAVADARSAEREVVAVGKRVAPTAKSTKLALLPLLAFVLYNLGLCKYRQRQLEAARLEAAAVEGHRRASAFVDMTRMKSSSAPTDTLAAPLLGTSPAGRSSGTSGPALVLVVTIEAALLLLCALALQ